MTTSTSSSRSSRTLGVDPDRSGYVDPDPYYREQQLEDQIHEAEQQMEDAQYYE